MYDSKKKALAAQRAYYANKGVSKMPIRLKNIAISFISLVKAGANKRKLIIKTVDGEPTIEFTAKIIKIDEEKRRFYSIVYPAGEEDTQGEFALAEDIEKAAYSFMKGLNALNIDADHSFIPENAYVAESWLIRKDDPLFPDEPEGSWAVGIIVEDDELWDQVQKGEIEAISMGGTADKVPDQAIDKSQLEFDFNIDDETFLESLNKNLRDFFHKFQKKGGESDMKKEEVQEMIDESIKKALDEIPKPLTKEEMAEVVKESLKPTIDRVEKIEKSSMGSKQGDGEIKTDEDLEKIGDDIAKMVNG